MTLGGEESQPLPWIVLLHGLGDTPENFIELVRGAPWRAHVYAARAPIAYGNGYDWFGVRVSAGSEALSRAVNAALEKLLAWLDQLEHDPKTRGKPIVSGFSQGGILSFAIAAKHPERITAALPIGGMLPRELWPEQPFASQAGCQVHAFHGALDPVIPLEPTRALVEALSAKGCAAQLETFPGVAHRIPPPLRAQWWQAIGGQLVAP